jgi:hypothetical protein
MDFGIHLYSLHAENQTEYKVNHLGGEVHGTFHYNNANLGVYVREDGVEFGVYKNTYNVFTWYLAKDAQVTDKLRVGLGVGTGYDKIRTNWRGAGEETIKRTSGVRYQVMPYVSYYVTPNVRIQASFRLVHLSLEF